MSNKAIEAALRNLLGFAEAICAKMEHPTASVTIIDQCSLRDALDRAQAALAAAGRVEGEDRWNEAIEAAAAICDDHFEVAGRWEFHLDFLARRVRALKKRD